MNYVELSKILKVLSNTKRLEIVDLLSCNRMCACELIDKFSVTQPTLSYDIKLLKEVNLITETIEGRKHYYEINESCLDDFKKVLNQLTSSKEVCACHR